jgi:hypothetical protein
MRKKFVVVKEVVMMSKSLGDCKSLSCLDAVFRNAC